MENLWIFIVGGVILFALLIAYLLVGRAKKGTFRGAIEELEIKRYEISNKPVMFELAKLKSVRKSEHIIGLVSSWEKRWKELEEHLLLIEDNIAYAEESVTDGDYEKADEIIEATTADLEALSKKADDLLFEIENLKSSEFRNRDGVVKLRENFIALQERYKKDAEIYQVISEEIKDKIEDIEAQFTKFDEQMDASNYDSADEVGEKIKKRLNMLKKILDKVPMYQDSINQDILPMLDGVVESHSALLQKGMFLGHLKVEATILEYKKRLDTISGLLKDFQFDEIEKLLVEVPNSAKKLREAMKVEIDVKEAFEQDISQLKTDSAFVFKEGRSLSTRYEELKEYCIMRTDDEENFKALVREIGLVESAITTLIDSVDEGTQATTDMHNSVIGYLTQLGEITEQLRIFDEEIITLQQHSVEINEKSVELLSTVNELKSVFEKYSADRNVMNYKQTIEKAEHLIHELLEESSKIPMDVAKVKLNLEVATDMINKAQKEVRLSVEQLQMAERLLVYGNRYIEREGMYLMDLTIAEDQFYQGNYETVIDKMYKILTDVEGNAFFKVFERLKEELSCVIL